MNFVFDVDGTLCFDGQTIAPRLIQTLKNLERQGHQVIFASARPIRDLLPIVPDFVGNLLIGGNGSIISREKQIDVIHYIPPIEYQAIIELILKYDLTYVIDGPFDYGTNVTAANNIFKQLDPANLAEKVPYCKIQRAIKIILVDIQPELFDTVQASLATIGQNLSIISHKNENSLDITGKKINKYSTLAKLNVTDYLAFGNDRNDVELLKHGQDSYVVGDEALARELGLPTTHVLAKDAAKIATVIEQLGGVKVD